MGTRCRLPFLFLVLLPLAACRRASVETYRIPKEKDPQWSDMMPGNAAVPSAPSPDGATMAGAAVPTVEGNALTWTAPADWVLEPAKQMRKAGYLIPAAGGQTSELTVTAFPSDVGGELANLNRWRGQVNLPPIEASAVESSVSRFTQGNLAVTFADFGTAGADGKRILGAIIPYQNGTWFFKLSGPSELVEGQKDVFLGFLKSIKEANP